MRRHVGLQVAGRRRRRRQPVGALLLGSVVEKYPLVSFRESLSGEEQRAEDEEEERGAAMKDW